jgi:hypothetical protein
MRFGYQVGSFPGANWRDLLKEKVKNTKWMDPRYNEQSSIKRLNNDDFGDKGVRGASFSYGHVDKGKAIGTTSYGEICATWALGKPVVIADANPHTDPVLEETFSYLFASDNDAADYLNRHSRLSSKYLQIKRKNSISCFENLLFAGDIGGIENTINQLSGRYNFFVAESVSDAKKYVPKADLIVLNFEKGHPYNPLGVSYLGVANALNITAISLDGNRIPYPPLTGLAKLVFVGDERGKNFIQFLDDPKPFIKYDLLAQIESARSKAKSINLKPDDKTLDHAEYENIYFSGSSPELAELKESMKGVKNVDEKFNIFTDLVVAEVPSDLSKAQKALEDMAFAYESKTPVLLLYDTKIVYQGIVELSRRPLLGDGRYAQAKKYLENLKSQNINDEAVVYYNLMNEFNSV